MPCSPSFRYRTQNQPRRRQKRWAKLCDNLSGIGRGEYIKLSTNKAHMDDFGR